MKCLAYLLIGLFVTVAPLQAQTVAPLDTTARQAFLLDANTNTELFAKNADQAMPTSSMSKMMTMYVVFDAIKNGKLSMNDELPVSDRAWKQEGSRMFLNVGQKAKVEDLIRGVIVQSGNDAAVVFAEALGAGTEANFAELMNGMAKKLGMNHSHFMNATGLPDPQHYSTARDLSILALALQHDFPEYYHYFSELKFKYNNIEQGNRNPLLYRSMNVDGLKTGHTDVGGFGLTASAIRDGRRLILVLNGLPTMQSRADESARVLDWGYQQYGLYTLLKADIKVADAKVWLGTAPTVSLNVSKDLVMTLPRSARASVKTVVTFDQPVKAPISKGQEIGKITVSGPGIDSKDIPLVAADAVPQLGFFARLMTKLHYMIYKV